MKTSLGGEREYFGETDYMKNVLVSFNVVFSVVVLLCTKYGDTSSLNKELEENISMYI